MKETWKHFVKTYKDFLLLKNNHKNPYKIHYVDLIVLLIMQGVIYLLLGMLFNQLTNLYFVILALNIILLTTYIFYTIKKDIAYKKANKIDYPLVIGIMDEVSLMLYSLTTINLVIYFIVYNPVVSFSFLIVLMLGSFISFLMHLFLRQYQHFNNRVKSTNPTLNILWMSILALLMFYGLGIQNTVLAYVVVFMLLIGIILINQYLIGWIDYHWIKRKHLAILLSFIFFFVLMEALIIRETRFESLYLKEANLSESVKTFSFEDYNPYFFTDGTYLYIDGPSFEVYDASLNLMHRYSKEDDTEYFVIDETVYKSVLSLDQTGLPSPNDSFVVRYDLYKETDDTFIYEASLVIQERFHSPKDIVLFKAYNTYYYTTRFGEGVYGLDGTLSSNLSPTPSRLIHNKNNHLVLAHNNRFYIDSHIHSGILHDGNYIGFDIDINTTCVTTVNNYLNFYPSCLGTEIPRIEGYQSLLMINDELYTYKAGYLNMNDNVLTHINHEGHVLFSSLEGFENIFYIEDSLYVTHKTIDTSDEVFFTSQSFYLIDPSNLSLFRFQPQALPIQLSVFTLCLIFVLIPIDLKQRK